MKVVSVNLNAIVTYYLIDLWSWHGYIPPEDQNTLLQLGTSILSRHPPLSSLRLLYCFHTLVTRFKVDVG